MIKDKTTADGKLFKSYLNESNAFTLEELVRQFPSLQLSIPVNFENWDINVYTPTVAFIPLDIDIETQNSILAYDMLGKEYKLSTKEEPNVPVLILGFCERIDGDGAPLFNNEQNVQMSGSQKTNSSDTMAVLKKLRLDDLHESWINGKAELYLSVREYMDYGHSDTVWAFKLPHSIDIERDHEGIWTADQNWSLYYTDNVYAGSYYSGYVYNGYVLYFWIELDVMAGLSPWPTSDDYGVNVSGYTYYIYGTNISDYLGYNKVSSTTLQGQTYSLFDSSTGDVRFIIYED
jgi:hypothetical protein